MVKIAVYLTGKTSHGGSYQYWLTILKTLSRLKKKEYNIIVYSPFQDWRLVAESLDMPFEIADLHLNFFQKLCVHLLPCFFPKMFDKKCVYVMCTPFLRKLKRERFDLWVGPTTDIGEDLLNIPTIVPIHDLMHRYRKDMPEVSGEFEERDKLYTYECCHAAMILVDSEVGKCQVIESYGDKADNLPDKVRILPFIPPAYIYEKKSRICEESLIFRKYCFYPAQFWTHKNHKKLLEAVKMLKDKDVIVNFIFVGSEQNNKENVLNQIAQCGLSEQIKILGYVSNEEMVYLYQHARALVMPTLFGPTNIPQLEAFEIGCPVATSNIYGIPEQVGDAALLFDPENAEEIAKCIEALWEDDKLCEDLIRKGKERARKWGEEEFSRMFFTYINEVVEKVNGNI